MRLPADTQGPVKVQVFTTAYRKVAETVLDEVPAGSPDVAVPLRDRKGKMLSNGAYYIRVITGSGESIGKLVILR